MSKKFMGPEYFPLWPASLTESREALAEERRISSGIDIYNILTSLISNYSKKIKALIAKGVPGDSKAGTFDEFDILCDLFNKIERESQVEMSWAEANDYSHSDNCTINNISVVYGTLLMDLQDIIK